MKGYFPSRYTGDPYVDLCWAIIVRALNDEGKVYDVKGELVKNPDGDSFLSEYKETMAYKIGLKGKVDSFAVACGIGSYLSE